MAAKSHFKRCARLSSGAKLSAQETSMVPGKQVSGGLFVLAALVLALPATAAKPRAGKAPPRVADVPPEFAYTTTAKYRRFRSLNDAATKGDVRTVQALLRGGVDVDGRDVGDDVAPTDRPLRGAAAAGHLEVVNVLLAWGANPDWCCCACV